MIEAQTNSIGGYLELELSKQKSYYPKAIALNTGRNALEYILVSRGYSKIYIPYFTCDAILEPITKINIHYEFYSINDKLEPEFDFTKIKDDEAFLYTNYFGVKDYFIKKIAGFCKNLILDNAQAFYSKGIKGIDSFNSPRKFFGISDGAYLFIDKKLETTFEKDISFDRMNHLLKRADISAEFGYADFCKNDEKLKNQDIKLMSNLTSKILGSVDYENIKKIRIKNFNYLHSKLAKNNKLNLQNLTDSVPLVYPFWTEDSSLKNKLLKNKLYCATYWPNVFDWCDKENLEYRLSSEIIALPIDQTWQEMDLEKILSIIQNNN